MSEIHTHDQELKRDPAIELARWIGCLIVIGCHTYLPIISGDNYDAGRLFFGLIFADGVAIFWLIGGAFLFNNTEYSKLLLRSVEKILLPMFLIGFIYICFESVAEGNLSFFNIITKLKVVFQNLWMWKNGFPSYEHSWYVYIYMLLMVAFPALKGVVTFAEQVRHRKYVIICGMIVFLTINDLSHNHIASFSHYMFNGLCAASLFTLIGHYLYQSRMRFQKKRYVFITPLIFTASTLIREMIQQNRGANDMSIMYWYSLFGVITASCVLIFCIALIPNKKATRCNKLICYLASYTFHIYLLHVLFIKIFDSTGISEDLENMILTWNSGMIGEAIYMIIFISMVFWSSFIAVFIFRSILRTCLKFVDSSKDKETIEQEDTNRSVQ